MQNDLLFEEFQSGVNDLSDGSGNELSDNDYVEVQNKIQSEYDNDNFYINFIVQETRELML